MVGVVSWSGWGGESCFLVWVGVFTFVVGDVVRLAKGSGGEGCLAGEAFEAVTVGGAMVGATVSTGVAVGGYGGWRSLMVWGCGGSDVVLLWWGWVAVVVGWLVVGLIIGRGWVRVVVGVLVQVVRVVLVLVVVLVVIGECVVLVGPGGAAFGWSGGWWVEVVAVGPCGWW